MIYCIELINCSDPHRVLREAVVSLPGLAEALALREVELPDGEHEVAQPGTVELPGARVHVIPLQQEMREDGTITSPAAVVIVDGSDADRWARRIDHALRKGGRVKGDYYVRSDGVKVALGSSEIANTGAQPLRSKAEQLADKSDDDL